jgi:hypothetical protein
MVGRPQQGQKSSSLPSCSPHPLQNSDTSAMPKRNFSGIRGEPLGERNDVSQLVGSKLPAPLRFEFGKTDVPGTPAQACLLTTIDADGSPRVAVLELREVGAPDERTVVVRSRDGSTTCANLRERKRAALWCVLDGAAYTVKGKVAPQEGETAAGWSRFVISIDSVWMDFEPSAPMIGGPTYRAAE